MHLYDPGTLIHLAFAPHAFARPHSLISTHSSVFNVVYPFGHEHLKDPGIFTQSAPFLHGLLKHSSISIYLLDELGILVNEFYCDFLLVLENYYCKSITSSIVFLS